MSTLEQRAIEFLEAKEGLGSAEAEERFIAIDQAVQERGLVGPGLLPFQTYVYETGEIKNLNQGKEGRHFIRPDIYRSLRDLPAKKED